MYICIYIHIDDDADDDDDDDDDGDDGGDDASTPLSARSFMHGKASCVCLGIVKATAI